LKIFLFVDDDVSEKPWLRWFREDIESLIIQSISVT